MENDEQADDISTDLLFGKEFSPKVLHYKGVQVEPASIGGKALTLLANAVFNSAFVIGEWIDRGLLDFAANATVLELGAGTGMPTFLLLQHPKTSLIKRAVITDYPAEEIMTPLRKNAIANDVADNPRVHVTGLDWHSGADIEQVIALNEGERYDLILAADLLWYTDAHSALVSCISQTLKRPARDGTPHTSTPRALVPSGTYAKRDDVRKFLKLAANAGLKYREMDLDTPFDDPLWGSELADRKPYEWKGSLDIFWTGEESSREDLSAHNLAQRKNSVYAFELQWA